MPSAPVAHQTKLGCNQLTVNAATGGEASEKSSTLLLICSIRLREFARVSGLPPDSWIAARTVAWSAMSLGFSAVGFVPAAKIALEASGERVANALLKDYQ